MRPYTQTAQSQLLSQDLQHPHEPKFQNPPGPLLNAWRNQFLSVQDESKTLLWAKSEYIFCLPGNWGTYAWTEDFMYKFFNEKHWPQIQYSNSELGLSNSFYVSKCKSILKGEENRKIKHSLKIRKKTPTLSELLGWPSSSSFLSRVHTLQGQRYVWGAVCMDDL